MIFKRLALLCALLAAGCAAWRMWGGIPVSAGPAPQRAEIPQASPERRAAALFYSDLGPDTVDISSYPPEIRRDYAVYARICASCHTLARSINSPYVGRSWWEFYIASMRMRAHFHGRPLSKEDIGSVLDFLEYDANERKVARAAQFEETKAELKRRFEAVLDERMEQLQRHPLPEPSR
ncbi:MAG: hypothetical protein PHS14_15575 [Elusimicrobia bacterium]|nr:hypothetical protein [Elusimicrobiota bacterium]